MTLVRGTFNITTFNYGSFQVYMSSNPSILIWNYLSIHDVLLTCYRGLVAHGFICKT